MRRSEVQTSSKEAADPGRVDLCGISPCGLGDCEPAPDPGKIQHLAALLDKQGVSWRYNTPSAGSSWTRANSICQLRFSRDWSRNVVLQLTMFFRVSPRASLLPRSFKPDKHQITQNEATVPDHPGYPLLPILLVTACIVIIASSLLLPDYCLG